MKYYQEIYLKSEAEFQVKTSNILFKLTQFPELSKLKGTKLKIKLRFIIVNLK